MNDCLFCKIIEGSIPSAKVYEDDLCYAFRDINPQARVHVVLVPKAHVANVCEAADQLDEKTLAQLFRAVKAIAASEGLKDGFRVISNCGKHGCQSVGHFHIHILGGEQLADKMA